jgi:hypothetical protein
MLIPLHITYNFNCGAEGSRTPGLLNAIQALSQLSYSPVNIEKFNITYGSCQLSIFNLGLNLI